MIKNLKGEIEDRAVKSMPSTKMDKYRVDPKKDKPVDNNTVDYANIQNNGITFRSGFPLDAKLFARIKKENPNVEFIYNLQLKKGFTPSFQELSKLRVVFFGESTGLTGANYGLGTPIGLFNNCDRLTKVKFGEVVQTVDGSGLFRYCRNLTSIDNMEYLRLTNMENMFLECNKLVSIPDLDVTRVEEVGTAFYGCKSLRVLHFEDSKAWTFKSLKDNKVDFSHCPLSEATKLELRKRNPSVKFKFQDSGSPATAPYPKGGWKGVNHNEQGFK